MKTSILFHTSFLMFKAIKPNSGRKIILIASSNCLYMV